VVHDRFRMRPRGMRRGLCHSSPAPQHRACGTPDMVLPSTPDFLCLSPGLPISPSWAHAHPSLVPFRRQSAGKSHCFSVDTKRATSRHIMDSADRPSLPPIQEFIVAVGQVQGPCRYARVSGASHATPMLALQLARYARAAAGVIDQWRSA